MGAPSSSEQRLLEALVRLVVQAASSTTVTDDLLDSGAVTAFEFAFEALAEHGLMQIEIHGRIFGRWTEAGKRLISALGYSPRSRETNPLSHYTDWKRSTESPSKQPAAQVVGSDLSKNEGI